MAGSARAYFPQREASGVSVEESVGIAEYANTAAGFQGILKQRFSDFVVREVGKDGVVCHLKNQSGKDLEARTFSIAATAAASSDSTSAAAPPPGAEVPALFSVEELMAELRGLPQAAQLSPADADNLSSFLSQCRDKSDECPESLTTTLQCSDKASRTALHHFFRRHAERFVDSDTVKAGTDSLIRLVARHKMSKSKSNSNSNGDGGGGGGGGRARKQQWPKDTPDFLEFTLCKENVDTMSAANFLNNLLHLKKGAIAYAGTKDKRAVTAQRCTVYRKRPSEMERVNKMFRPYILRLGDFQYVSKGASLGDLGGNRFSITLRAIKQSEETVKEACRALEQSGFINYFGLQRFGQGDNARSHDVGRALFLGQWKAVVDMLFHPREGERGDIQHVKRLYAQGKFAEAAAAAPIQMHSERQVLQALTRSPQDFSGAIACMPKFTRLLCVHAYQSFLWNKAASRRLTRYGRECVVGDLVAVNPAALLEEECQDLEGAPHEAEAEGEGEGDGDVEGEAGRGGDSFQSAKNKVAGAIRPLTQQDIDARTFTLRDVVLPICGYDSLLPQNETGTDFTDMLAQDGLSLDSFRTCHPVYRMTGAYRRLLQVPAGLSWRILRYSDPNAELARTELTHVRARPGDALPPAGAEAESPEGPLRALSLEFTLPPGTYATMLLREVTKESTETQYQAQLTAQEASSHEKRPREEEEKEGVEKA
jgi:tRNA pseudouridine13 synthase